MLRDAAAPCKGISLPALSPAHSALPHATHTEGLSQRRDPNTSSPWKAAGFHLPSKHWSISPQVVFMQNPLRATIKVQCSEPIWIPAETHTRGASGHCVTRHVGQLEPSSCKHPSVQPVAMLWWRPRSHRTLFASKPEIISQGWTEGFWDPIYTSLHLKMKLGVREWAVRTHTPGCSGFRLDFHFFFFPPMKAWWEREKGRKEQFLFSICFHRNTEIKRKKRLLTSSCPYTCQHSSEQQPWSFLQHLFSIKVYI